MPVSTSGAGGPETLQSLIQQDLLLAPFRHALFPRLQWRMDLPFEPWRAQTGESKVLTRNGLMPVKVRPLTPGSDPEVSTYATEQWRVEASQQGDTIDVNMAASYVSLADTFINGMHTLGMNAGQTMNRVARDRMLTRYLSGNTTAFAAAGAGATTIAVNSVGGFLEQLTEAGKLLPVSAANPIGVSFSTANEPDNFVISAAAADPSQPYGQGVITLQTPTTNAIAARDGVYSANRPVIIRAGTNTATVDGIDANATMTLSLIQSAVSRLRASNVPPFPDGKYRCKLTPAAENQLFNDPAWQRLQTSLPDRKWYQEFVIGELLGVVFMRDTEVPDLTTVSADSIYDSGTQAKGSSDIGADLVNNTGLPIARAFVYGAEVAREFALDESQYVTQGGVNGKIGSFNVTNGGYEVMTDRIRMIIRAPQDRLQQVYSLSWSWSGDFGIPSDQLSGDAARYKRAVVIEHVGA